MQELGGEQSKDLMIVITCRLLLQAVVFWCKMIALLKLKRRINMLREFDIINGVLVKYNGFNENVVIRILSR